MLVYPYCANKKTCQCGKLEQCYMLLTLNIVQVVNKV